MGVRWGVFVAVAAFAGMPLTLGFGAGRTDALTCNSLTSTSGAPVTGGELKGVDYVSAGETWAVGDEGSALHAERTLIERFDGSAWSVIPSPNQGNANNALNSVSMASGVGWAVGYAQHSAGTSGGTYEPLALQWNGTTWSLNSPSALPSHSALTSVDTLSSTDAWTVGFQTAADGTRSTLIEENTGGAWTQVPSPNDGGATATDNTLMAVGGTQATGLWAVGYWLSPSGERPLVLRYDTTQPSPTWVSVSGAGGVPAPGAIGTVLTGVDVVSASDVWATGYYTDGGAVQPLVLHWDGSTWSNPPVPGIGMLRQIQEVSPTNVWAVGAYYDPAQLRYQTLVVHFDGTAWTTSVSANSGKANDQLIAIAADPLGQTITTVGRSGPNPIIEQASCPTGPVSLATRTPPPVPPTPVAPGVGPAPSPPPPTPPATTPVPVTITDQATAAGIAGPTDWTFSAAVADINGDGWPDIFIARHWHPANLWLNNQNGTFSGSDASFFRSVLDRHDCLPADYNQDGLTDLFCSVGADRGTALKCNGLFVQQPGGTFTDQSYQWNSCDPTGRGRYGTVLDANHDGYPDIFYGTDNVAPDGLPSVNRLYLNTGNGSFIDSPAMGLDLNIGAVCAHTVDYNSDGWPDLLVCGETGGLHLFENMQGHGFKDVSSILGPPVNAWDAVMVDVNHDNLPDLITLTGTTVAERLQRADGTFAAPKTILKVQGGKSLAVGDVNGDNNPDIYVVCGRAGTNNAPDYLLIGDASGGFTTMSIPETTVGDGDQAYPIDWNHSGLTSFLVLNGQVPYSGPVQLLTPTAATGHRTG